MKQYLPWLQIWINPRKAMRQILAAPSDHIPLWLAMIAGATSACACLLLNREALSLSTHRFPFLAYLSVGIVGALAGAISLYFFGWLYTWVGALLGGKGKFPAIKKAVGWSNYPLIFSNIFGILQLAIHGHPWFLLLISLVSLGAWIWSISILLSLLSEAHHFSIWKTAAMLALAFLLFIALFLVIGMFLPRVQPIFQ